MIYKKKIKKKGYTKENHFPIDVFPSDITKLIIGLNESLKFPIDYTGTAILTAVSTTIGTSVKVRVKSNWYEFGSLYTSVIGNAGANKSHPVAIIFNPLKEIDQKYYDIYAAKYEEYEAYMKLSSRERQMTTPVVKPILSKLILSNFTPEVLNNRLNDNPRGCTVLSDELASFFEGMNNYSKSDTSSNYLSYWSNQSVTVDRVSKPKPIMIKTPYLSIIGGLQPRILRNVFNPQKINSGFFQRFLFSYPEDVYKEPISDKELDKKVLEKYSDFIKDYIESTSKGSFKTRVLNWTKEAKDYFYKWQKKNCFLVNENQTNIKGEIISKFDNHFIRLSLILQMMEDPKSTEISLKAVKGAKKLCQYYMRCSLKVLDRIQNPIYYLQELPDNKMKFYKALKNNFTTSEAIELGLEFDLKERRIKDFVKHEYLFKKIKHGHFEKMIKSKPKN